MSGVTCLRWQVHFVITPFTAAKFQPWSTSVAGAYQAAIANFSSLAAQEQEIDRSVFQLDATVEERRYFQSDCELQPVPSQIWVLKEDNALPCDLLMQTSRHNFISTLSKKFSHTLRSLTKFFSIQNWVLLPYCLLCHTALLSLMTSWQGSMTFLWPWVMTKQGMENLA